MNAAQARELAKKLIAQAVDESVSAEEARTFALKAAKVIDEHDLLVEPFNVVSAMANPEVGEAVGAVVDLVGRLRKSGIGDSIKRAVGASRRAVRATRERQGPRRRRH